MSCSHELVQLSQDGKRTLVCGGCEREFGHFSQHGEPEIFVAYVEPGHPMLVVARDAGMALGVTTTGRGLATTDVFPCATCGWAFSCDPEDGGCHT